MTVVTAWRSVALLGIQEQQWIAVATVGPVANSGSLGSQAPATALLTTVGPKAAIGILGFQTPASTVVVTVVTVCLGVKYVGAMLTLAEFLQNPQEHLQFHKIIWTN